MNVKTGELTITHGYIEFDGSENWYYTSSLNRVYVSVPDALKDITHSIYSNVIAFNQSYTPSDFTGHINPQGNFEIFAPSSITNAEDWKTWLANNNIQLVYELATPTTVQLTPTEVRTLLEDNNIFSDTGDINKLVYFKTGCEPIARLIEAYGIETEVAGTLTAGQTSITLTSNAITTNSTIDVYTDADVDYNSISVSTGSVTITFEAQASNMKVKARIS